MAKLPVVQTPTKLRVVQLKTKKQKQKQTNKQTNKNQISQQVPRTWEVKKKNKFKECTKMTKNPQLGKGHKDPQSIPNEWKVSKAPLNGLEVTKETPP